MVYYWEYIQESKSYANIKLLAELLGGSSHLVSGL